MNIEWAQCRAFIPVFDPGTLIFHEAKWKLKCEGYSLFLVR